jgi:hypothetical protein
MAINIKRLICNVTVKTGDKQSPLAKDAKAQRPDLLYAMPNGQPAGQAGPLGAETATHEKGPAAQSKEASPSAADPRRVAERVYDLMKQEVIAGRARGIGNA